MPSKAAIIDALGEARLLVPARLNAALAASERVKYLFSLLQMAQAQALRPDAATLDLSRERAAAGVDDDRLDELVTGARTLPWGEVRMPGVGTLCNLICVELQTMLEPIRAAEHDKLADFSARLRAVTATPLCIAEDRISEAQIAAMTSGQRGRGDSLHLLAMDVHKALTALEAKIAEEDIDGASCYGLGRADRTLVGAFMRGIARTRALKFDHPGLATIAARVGERLVIQNDVGANDAHVLVVHVGSGGATLTYTDVHLQRLMFFRSLFDDWDLDWEDTRSRSSESLDETLYHLAVGRFEAEDAVELEPYLEHLGSKLVFLIDWNRARKRLRSLLPKGETLALLKWAASENVGHMGMLRADAPGVIVQALGTFAHAGGAAPETRLDDLLGARAATEFMRFAARACTQGLLAGRAEAPLHDEIRAALARHFRDARQSLLDVASEHAALIAEIAGGVRDALLHSCEPDAIEQFSRNASRAAQWEQAAYALMQRARGMVRQSDRGEFYRDLIESANAVADSLEEAAFHLTLLRTVGSREAYAELARLAEVLALGTREYLRAIEASRRARRGGPRDDAHEFHESIDRIAACERESDAAQRSVKRVLVDAGLDMHQFYALTQCARSFESAADALLRATLMLRDGVLGEVMLQ